MINNNVLQALNEQIIAELFASNLYLQVAAKFCHYGFHGFCDYMKKQADEERCHALKIYDYILQQDCMPIIDTIDSVSTMSISNLIEDIFEMIYIHEKKITTLINNATRIAISDGDFATISFLQWFVDEQVQEEKNAYLLMQKVGLIGDDMSGLLSFDSEIAAKNKDEIALKDFEL
jgi:ferritin